MQAVYQESVGALGASCDEPGGDFAASFPDSRFLSEAKEFSGNGDIMIKRMIRDMMFMCPLRLATSQKSPELQGAGVPGPAGLQSDTPPCKPRTNHKPIFQYGERQQRMKLPSINT